MGTETDVSFFFSFLLTGVNRLSFFLERERGLYLLNYFRLPGPPLSKRSSVGELLDKGVNVAIGVSVAAAARNTRFEVAWVSPTSQNLLVTFF